MKENTGTSNKGLRLIGNAISVLLHPVFMPLISCIVLYYTMPEAFANIRPKVLNGWLGMIVINTIIFPVLTILLLKGLGFIKSIYLKDVKERVIPLIGTMVFYFWPYLVAKNVQAPESARILMLGNFWGIVIVFIVTIFYKISMHTSGVGAFLGFVIVLMLISKSLLVWPLVLALSMAALIFWARYIVGAHSKKELWMGIAAGIVTQIAAYLYIL